MVRISQLSSNYEKEKITKDILELLPEWFGIEQAIIEYTKGVENSDFYVAFEDESPIGFVSIKAHNIYTSEIYLIAILKEFQNKGIGKALLKKVEENLVVNKVKFLMVKTLGESHPDQYYKRTRGFYHSVGFYPLEELNAIWGEENPCLIMVKPYKNDSMV